MLQIIKSQNWERWCPYLFIHQHPSFNGYMSAGHRWPRFIRINFSIILIKYVNFFLQTMTAKKGCLTLSILYLAKESIQKFWTLLSYIWSCGIWKINIFIMTGPSINVDQVLSIWTFIFTHQDFPIDLTRPSHWPI